MSKSLTLGGDIVNPVDSKDGRFLGPASASQMVTFVKPLRSPGGLL